MIKHLSPMQHATCQCGACQFIIAESTPVARFICHCFICQQFNDKPFADVTIMSAKHVQVQGRENIEFKKYRLPPNIERGLCRACGKPAIEFGGVGAAKISFIPSDNFKNKDLLPPPATHIFYHRRVEDIMDDLPKYKGYVASELAAMKLMFGVLKA